MADPIRIAFAGTPEFALPVLNALHEACNAGGGELVGVLTQPDRPAGRGRSLRQSPVKTRALELGLPVHQPRTLRNEAAQQALRDLAPDLLVVIAYGLLLPQEILDTPRLGCVNVHASLLPRWRGAAPIQRALLAGDAETGVTIMQMDAGLDTGPVWSTARCDIAAGETGGSLHDKLAALGASTLIDTLPEIVAGETVPTPQADDGVTYADKLRKSEARIDWNRSATDIERQVRAFDPWPVADTLLAGKQLRIWEARAIEGDAGGVPGTVVSEEPDVEVATARGRLRLISVQRAGSRRMSAAEFINAHRLAGVILG